MFNLFSTEQVGDGSTEDCVRLSFESQASPTSLDTSFHLQLGLPAPGFGTLGRITFVRVVAKFKSKHVTDGRSQVLFLVLTSFGKLT